jgi:endoglycosylceramidase
LDWDAKTGSEVGVGPAGGPAASTVSAPADGFAAPELAGTFRRRIWLVMKVTSRVGIALTSIIALALSGGLGVAVADVPQGATSIGYLGHSGRWITTEDGRVVILHGLNMVSKRAPFTPASVGFGTAAAATLADSGFDVVRLGVLYQAVEPRPGVISNSYLTSIDKTVTQLASDGIYSLLDFHQDEMNQEFGGEGFPKWSVLTDGLTVKKYVFPNAYTRSQALNRAYDNFWSNTHGPVGVGLQQSYVLALDAVARTFKDDPWVLGYDVFNEPWPAAGTTKQLTSFYKRAIAGVRSIDKNHLIWYEPWVTFNFGVATRIPSIADDLLGMSFHDYCLGDKNCAASEQKTVNNALAHSRSTGVALLLSEFGASDNYPDLERVVSISDSSQLSWIEWSYCGCDDPTGSIPPSLEGLVDNPRLPGTGTNVDQSKLMVLAEPYARLVAGTPLSYSFDSATGTYRLTYSTVSPAGLQFADGACTAIEIPSIRYPTGYQVTVSGGQVSSPAGSGVLEVTSTVSSGSIKLTVSPTAHGETGVDGPIPAGCTA